MPRLYISETEKKELETRNGALQFLAVLEQIEACKSGPPPFTSELIKQLQYRAIVGIYSCAGEFRTGPVSISDTEHEPPPWGQIPELVDQMADYLNQNWDLKSASHLCAYAMWRLNWIHPFFGGNGRTSRACAYLALSARWGFRLPGKVTLPDHIVARRSAYINALKVADAAWAQGQLDVLALEDLVESVLAAQLVDVLGQATGKSNFS